jgi:hypothetical protein
MGLLMVYNPPGMVDTVIDDPQQEGSSALAEKLESKTKVGDLATAAKAAEPKVREWLAVLTRCFPAGRDCRS